VHTHRAFLFGRHHDLRYEHRTVPGAIRRLLSASSDLGLGASYLITWISPTAFGSRGFPYLLLVMLFEFIVIHSAALMGSTILSDGSRLKKFGSVLALAALYSLFVFAYVAIFHVWWPATAFALLTLNRLTPVLLGTRRNAGSAIAQTGWAASAATYVIVVILTVLVPLPRLGVTPAVVAAAHLPGTGIWVDEPYRLLAAGGFYFTVQGLAELFAWV
jgi:hypothetical protein